MEDKDKINLSNLSGLGSNLGDIKLGGYVSDPNLESYLGNNITTSLINSGGYYTYTRTGGSTNINCIESTLRDKYFEIRINVYKEMLSDFNKDLEKVTEELRELPRDISIYRINLEGYKRGLFKVIRDIELKLKSLE